MITKAELTKQLLAEQQENQLLRQQCSKLLKDREKAEQDLFQAKSVLRELRRRWKVHQEEFPKACVDVYAVGVKTGEVVKPVFSKAMASLTLAGKGFIK
tara:strand:- start:40 stop:336 length:297 start_codon:yes stop_codon:yes gene_type:complete